MSTPTAAQRTAKDAFVRVATGQPARRRGGFATPPPEASTWRQVGGVWRPAHFPDQPHIPASTTGRTAS